VSGVEEEDPLPGESLAEVPEWEDWDAQELPAYSAPDPLALASQAASGEQRRALRRCWCARIWRQEASTWMWTMSSALTFPPTL